MHVPSRRMVLFVAAAAVALVGLYLAVVVDSEGVVWFAYSQTADATSGPTILLLTAPRIVGLALISAGLLTLASLVGFRIGLSAGDRAAAEMGGA